MANAPIRLLRTTVEAMARRFGGVGPDLATRSFAIDGLPMRLYEPDGSRGRPPLIFFHGGGFITCGLDSHDAVCRRLAAASGLRILAVDYRLAPEHPAPAQLEDAIRACRWVLDDPDEIRGGSVRIFVAGDSAGGYLALRCAAAMHADDPRVAGLLLIYPLVHLDPRAWGKHAWKPGRWVGRVAVSVMRRQLGQAEYPPLSRDELERMPRTVIISGNALDPVHDDCVDLAAHLKASGVAADHIMFPRLFHGALNIGGALNVVDRAGAILKTWCED